jgi:N-acetylmuramic acid 6-phosphate etherase
MLATESLNSLAADLDTWDTLRLAQAFAEDQLQAVAAVQKAASQIAKAVDAALPRLANGGRLIYVGAGTSGRLGLLDAVELTPTFSWPPQRALSCMAGGEKALWKAVEGAEDNLHMGKQDLLNHTPTNSDVVIGLAASGTTPYVQGALEAAKELGALSIGIANNPNTPVVLLCDIPIVLETGPELIAGSTRLKAGTAQKIALNTFSSSIMVRLGKVYGNLMVDVQPTNVKLKERALRLVMTITGAHKAIALEALEASGYQVKVAAVMVAKDLGANVARELIKEYQGNLRATLS